MMNIILKNKEKLKASMKIKRLLNRYGLIKVILAKSVIIFEIVKHTYWGICIF